MQRGSIVMLALAACGHSSSKPSSAAPPAPAIAATLAIVDVTVLPMDTDRELPHQTVLIDHERIVAVGPTATTVVPAGAQRVDGRGKWLLPGLIDMHVHFNDDRDGLLFVANGVTTVRNMWGGPQQLAWRAKSRENAAGWIAPSIVTAGPIVDGDPPTWPGSKVVTTAEAAVAEVAAEQQAGYDFIKVYDGLPLAAYDALAAAAKRANMRFVGHVPAAAGLEHALAAGQASIEHLTGYMMAAQDATSRAATLPRAEQRAELAAHLDERKLPALAKATRDAGAANIPTLVVLARFGALDHPEALLARPENKYVSPVTLASWDPKQDFRLKSMTADAFEAIRKGNGFRAKLVKALVDAGAPVFAGTDTPNPFVVPGFALHEELALLVGAGLTPFQALRAATAAPAAWLGMRDAGTVAVGMRADLVLLAADPRRDIAATKQRVGVVLRGTWFAQPDLDAKLEDLAAGYAAHVDRFAGVAPPVLDDGVAQVDAATFTTLYANTEVGKERVVVGKLKNGHRLIIAQGAAEPPQAKHSAVRLELDEHGKLVAFDLDEDGKHATATRKGGVLHITGADGARDEKLPDDVLLDANLMSTMQPFIDRAVDGKKVEVAGKGFSGAGALSEGGYTLERKGKELHFVAHAPWGSVPGDCQLDAHGTAYACTLRAGSSIIQILRSAR